MFCFSVVTCGVERQHHPYCVIYSLPRHRIPERSWKDRVALFALGTFIYMIMGPHQLLNILQCAVTGWTTGRQMTLASCGELHPMVGSLPQQPAGPASFILVNPPEKYSGAAGGILPYKC